MNSDEDNFRVAFLFFFFVMCCTCLVDTAPSIHRSPPSKRTDFLQGPGAAS